MKTLLIILFSFSVSAYSQGFFSKVASPEGKYMSTTNNADTNHYSLQYAMNGVYGGSWSLVKELKDTYTYPNHGWIWADNRREAKQTLGLIKVRVEDGITDEQDDNLTGE